MDPFPRVAGCLGNIIKLNMNILRNGIPQDPFAIRQIQILRGSPRLNNVVATIPIVDPTNPIYPSPITRVAEGQFEALFSVPTSFIPNDVYFDLWSFIPNDPGTNADLTDESIWVTQSGVFWLYDDVWIVEDELHTKRLGFEPLDKKLRRGEVRTIEVAIHPLPKYDYDFNKLAPIIPQLSPTITIHTVNNELLVKDVPCTIGIRQGNSRNSPFVVRCLIDTRTLLRGTYQYTIKVSIGNSSLISPQFYFTVQ